MTVSNLITQIMISISEVMETMFYIPVEPQETQTTFEESGMTESGNMKAATITFRGIFSGTIDLIVPETLLIIMTENFMGEKKEHLTQEHLDGTLKEGLNMLAGNTFSKIDKKSSFCLGVPKINTSAINDKAYLNKPLFVIDTMDGSMGIVLNLI